MAGKGRIMETRTRAGIGAKRARGRTAFTMAILAAAVLAIAWTAVILDTETADADVPVWDGSTVDTS